MAIDSHTHVNSAFVSSVLDEIKRINEDSNLKSVINVGVDYLTSKEASEISTKHDKFYSAVGIHPLYVDGQDISRLYDLVATKTVAIGEIGFDENFKNLDTQRQYFIEQIKLANELLLPIIIHSASHEKGVKSSKINRMIFDIFDNVVKPEYGCVFHCFQPFEDDLDYIIKHGYYISFGGHITFLNAKKSLKIAEKVPMSRFLVETDSPYFTPEPFRGEPNHSSNVEYVIQKIAEIKKEKYERIEEVSEENTKKLFKMR